MAGFKRVNVIMDTKFNGTTNENMAASWNTMCLAEYFFFSYFNTGYKTYRYPFYNCNEYYRGNTKLVSYEYIIKKRERYYENGKQKYRFVYDIGEYIIISKRDNYKGWHVVFESNDMNETAELLFNMDNIYTIGWHTVFQEFIFAYEVLTKKGDNK